MWPAQCCLLRCPYSSNQQRIPALAHLLTVAPSAAAAAAFHVSLFGKPFASTVLVLCFPYSSKWLHLPALAHTLTVAPSVTAVTAAVVWIISCKHSAVAVLPCVIQQLRALS